MFCHGLGNPLVHGADGGPFVGEACEGDVRVVIGFVGSRGGVYRGDGVLFEFVRHGRSSPFLFCGNLYVFRSAARPSGNLDYGYGDDDGHDDVYIHAPFYRAR